MSKITGLLRQNRKFLYLAILFVATGLFLFGATIRTRAEDLGFGPALIETANCMIGSAPCQPDTAQEVHLFQAGPNSTSALAGTGALIDNMYTSPPSSAVVWAYDQVQRMQNRELLAVYAQDISDPNDNSFYFPGLGYNLLMPMRGLWNWSRNFVYVFYIVIIIVIAFLILFRQSLGGQTAVNIVNALPSLILSLVLVTFSYPIAGFFVDLIYIGSNVVQGTLISSSTAPGYEFTKGGHIFGFLNENDQPRPDINFLQPDDPEVSVWAIWGTSGVEIFDCPDNNPDGSDCYSRLLPQLDNTDGSILQYIGKVLPVVEQAANLGVGIVSGNGLLNLIIGLTALMASFRLFMALLKSYISLVLAPLFLPWLFFTAAIPSRTKPAIINAIKPLLAASLSFIAIYAVFLLMIIIGRSDSLGGAVADAGEFRFAPPLLGYATGQVGEAGGNVTRGLTVFVLFLATPTIPDMMNSLLHVQSGGQLMSQVGQSTAQSATQLFGGITSLRSRIKGKK